MKTLIKLQFYIIATPVFLLVCLFFPLVSDAFTTHNYVCSDFHSIAGGATCTGNTATYTGSGGYVFDNTSIGGNLSPSGGESYYITFTASGSGTGYIQCGGSNNDGTPVSFSGSVTDQPFSCGSPNTSGGLVVGDNSSFVGTVTDICVSDTLGACAPPTPPTPTSTSPMYVYNPNEDTFNIVLLFLMSAWGAVWLFRKRN